MNILSINTWFVTLIKQFFFSLDQIVFNFISDVYELLIAIARTSILSQSDISAMAEKIYMLLTVFMVFKVTLSLITYVVNPDDFSDKSKGLSKLGTNIIISLSLLILTPYIFRYALELQTIVLEDNSLAKLIFETEKSNSDVSIINTAGEEISFTIMSAFFTPNTSITQLRECGVITNKDNSVNKECFGVEKDSSGNYTIDTEYNSGATLAGLTEETSKLEKKDVYNYAVGVEKKNLGLMFRQELAVATVEVDDETFFIMDYKFVFSTVIGIVVILLLLTYCMDVALRSIKLSFLQLIAPIPILSYVDPKSGKDGMFKKWYDMCFKTYISLFVRLLALYFAVYIIGRVDNMVDIVDGSYVTSLFVKIFVIIGALMFAKQLPKMLEGLGIKLDGDGKFTLNPLQKFEDQAFGGKNITGMARGALVGTAGMLTGAGAMAGLSGAWRGLTSGKGWKETGKAEAEMNKKMRQAKLDGSTFTGRLGAKFAAATGFMSQSENIAQRKHELEQDVKAHEDVIKSNQEEKKRIEAQKKAKKESLGITEGIRKSKIVSDSTSATKSVATEKLATSKGAAGDRYRALETESRVLNDNIGRYRNSSGAFISFSEYESLSDADKADWNVITQDMATHATNKFTTYKEEGWLDFVEDIHYGRDSDLTIEGKISAAIRDIGTVEGKDEATVIAELEADPDGFAKALKKKMGEAKGNITKLESLSREVDEEYVKDIDRIDKTIESETIAKEQLDEQIRELRETEARVKADETAIK